MTEPHTHTRKARLGTKEEGARGTMWQILEIVIGTAWEMIHYEDVGKRCNA